MESTFFRFLLDATSYRSGAYVGLAIGLPLFVLCLYNIKKALSRMEDIRLSPSYQALQRYSPDAERLAALIDSGAAGGDARQFKPLTLTPSWLLHETFFQFTAIHLADIVWLFPKEVQHYTYFVPTGKTHSLVVSDAAGMKVVAQFGRGKKARQRIDELTAILLAKIPWVATGYSHEMKQLYEKNLPAFRAGIVERRRQAQQTRADILTDAPFRLVDN